VIRALLLLPACLFAQRPAPKFEVVSIRVVPRDTPPTMREPDFTPVLPGGQYIDSRAALISMIAFAYNVKNPSTQLAGLPDWAKQESYAIAAKPAAGFPALPPAENREQVRLMMGEMLTDRFHLRLHTQTREEPVFRLEVAKGGIKLREVDPPMPPAKEGPVNAAAGNDGGRMIGNQSTMAGLAMTLAIFLKRPVIDATGLKGYYDFDVKWSAADSAAGPGLGPEGISLLISMLPVQLGLRVSKAVGPVEYWVVDHIEQPAPN
jgi:uncharacterized protein (TIGR03435 family)